jgi:glycosyltransferase involved in cell wall biosynthesis
LVARLNVGTPRLWRADVAVANLGTRPSRVDDVSELRTLALLRDGGFEVHAVLRGLPQEESKVDGVRIWTEPTMVGVARRIALLRPELLLVESITYGVVLEALAKRSWIRNLRPAVRPQMRRLQSAALRRSDAVSFSTPADRDAWAFREEQYVDLPYPVDLSWWGTAVPHRDAWWTERGWSPPRGLVLVCVSAYTRGKRVCELLETLAPFLTQNPSATLVLAGHPLVEPEVTEQLTAMPAALGVSNQVLITGWLSQSEIRELLGWASVAIINSRSEQQCLSIFEALAAGVPTLISAIPPLTSMFPALPAHTDGYELRANLERLLADPALGRSLIESSQERLAWADIDRHDEVFAAALSRLLKRPVPISP